MDKSLRRSPRSLQSLCKSGLINQALEAVLRIQGRAKLSSWIPFVCMEAKTYRRHSIRQVQNYLATLPSLFNELGLELYRQDPSMIEALMHPSLRTLEVHSCSLALVLDHAYLLQKLTTLYLFFDINRHVLLAPKLYRFLGSLIHLTHLKASNCITDQLLAVIGTNCKSLRVLDAEEDSEMTITDQGLAFLANCKQLTKIIFNDAGDEYDYEDRYFGITGMGIANLIISLPNLTHLICEPYLLRGALRFVEQVNVNDRTFDLRYLHIKAADVSVMNLVQKTCPKVEELVLEEQSRDVAETLPSLKNLTSLRLENFSFSWSGSPLSKEESHLAKTFSRLRRLSLKNPKQAVVDADWLRKLGGWCKRLQSFSLTLYQPDGFTRLHQLNLPDSESREVQTFFPELDTLVLDGDLSLCLAESLLNSISGLKRLTIYIHDLGYSTGHFDSMMLRLARSGRLRQLTHLTCFQWPVSLETMLFVIDQCPELRAIYGLDLLMLCPRSILLIQTHITRNNRAIDLFDAQSGGCNGDGYCTYAFSGLDSCQQQRDDLAEESVLIPTCRGIPFLSERSRHRVEAADQEGAGGGAIPGEDTFEHVLKEGTFENLLKEVYLL